jgi:tRNA nucleotidyltransferase (CCA-adding enzyme)
MYRKLKDHEYTYISREATIQEIWEFCKVHEQICWVLIFEKDRSHILGCLSKKAIECAISYNLYDIDALQITDPPPATNDRKLHISLLKWDREPSLSLLERIDIEVQNSSEQVVLSLAPNMIEWCQKIGHIAQECNISIFLVGGAVRDMMLHQKAEDLDFLFFGDRHLFGQKLQETYGGNLHMENRFGALHWTTDDGIPFDFTHARGEIYKAIAELPVIHPSSLFDDLYRRDFTPNAMAICITPPYFGVLLDPFDGKKDLNSKTFRVLHGLSFVQDPTRIFRMARYCGRYECRPDQHSLFLATSAVQLGVCSQLTKERIGTEITKIFSESQPSSSWKLLENWDVINFILPSLSDQFVTHLQRLERNSNLCSLFHFWILLAFHLSQKERKTNSKFVASHKGLSGLFSKVPSEMEEIAQKIPQLTTIIESGWLFSKKHPSSLNMLLFIQPSLQENEFVLWWQSKGQYISSPIQGKDLILLGFPKGPLMGKALRRGQELAWLGNTTEQITHILLQDFDLK